MESLDKASNKFRVKKDRLVPRTSTAAHRRKIVPSSNLKLNSRRPTRNYTAANTDTTNTCDHSQRGEAFIICSHQERDSIIVSKHDKENPIARQ